MEELYKEMCIESPLYTVFRKGERLVKEGLIQRDLVTSFSSARVQYDGYCIECGQEATFVRQKANGRQDYDIDLQKLWMSGIFSVVMRCARRGHTNIFLFRETNDAMQKVGMYPSMEDIAASDIKKYRSILGKKYYSELHRAGGLASHGIGIGSFVYLRRIFEKQIDDHYERRKRDLGEIIGFVSLRMDEKIAAITDYLPATIAKHKSIYSILSQGVHELDEETCLAFFPVLKKAIVLILEQDYQIKEREKAEKELEKEMAVILGRAEKGG